MNFYSYCVESAGATESFLSGLKPYNWDCLLLFMANINIWFSRLLNSNNLPFLPIPWIQELPVEHKNKEMDNVSNFKTQVFKTQLIQSSCRSNNHVSANVKRAHIKTGGMRRKKSWSLINRVLQCMCAYYAISNFSCLPSFHAYPYLCPAYFKCLLSLDLFVLSFYCYRVSSVWPTMNMKLFW